MDPLKILKALSNPHRLDIILWLKHPEKEFGVQVHSKTLIDFPHSVSVKSIQKPVSYTHLDVYKRQSPYFAYASAIQRPIPDVAPVTKTLRAIKTSLSIRTISIP